MAADLDRAVRNRRGRRARGVRGSVRRSRRAQDRILD